MGNQKKYNAVFTETFMVEDKDLPALKYQGIPTWDSLGHMALIAALEETFGIELDIDDIIEFSSYNAGQAILAKYGVVIENVG
ncbi:MAG: acyl carrier protein [Mariprofundaceae bacterium]